MTKRYTLQSLRAALERLEAVTREASWIEHQERETLKVIQQREHLLLQGQAFALGGLALSLFMVTSRRGLYGMLACGALFVLLGYLHHRLTATAAKEGRAYKAKQEELMERHHRLIAESGLSGGLRLLEEAAEDGGQDLWTLDDELPEGRYYLGHLEPNESLEGHRQEAEVALDEIAHLNKLFAAEPWSGEEAKPQGRFRGFSAPPWSAHREG